MTAAGTCPGTSVGTSVIGVLVAAAVTAAVGCGGSGAFGLSAEDNNPEALARALARHTSPASHGPRNRLGTPLALLVARADRKEGRAQQLIAFDLDRQRELWRVATGVASRVLVTRDLVVHLDDRGLLVARDVATGDARWTAHPGVFRGAAVDRERVYYVREDRSGDRPVWSLVALDGATGDELWRADSPGLLGVPAARGGLVFSPFLKQWLAVLDARTGEQITRIRGIDEEISFVRATRSRVYFGSKSGVFALDGRAATGRRATSTYGRVQVPEELSPAHYHWDAFDRVQAGYSAYDRHRLLWRGRVRDGGFGFAGDVVVVHVYRFFFAVDSAGGALRWAYSHPRYDVIGAEHVGPAIAFASGLGELGALDPRTGERLYAASVDEQLTGVTFDAEGWAPRGDAAPARTATALVAIARDRDARFHRVKRFAVAALAALPDAEVTRDLVALLGDERTPGPLHDKAVEVLVARRDPRGLPYLIEALGTPHDHLAGSRPRGVGAVARVIGALGRGGQLSPAQRAEAADALLAHVRAPQTPLDDLAEVIRALGAVGTGAEIAPLSAFVLGYRADPGMAEPIAPMAAAIDALLDGGGAAGRALVAFVAGDARTQAAIAEYARRALRPRSGPRRAGENAEKAR